MQAEIGDTMYKDDATVRANLQELLDGIGEGVVYFAAASEDFANVQDNREKGIVRSDARMAYIDRVMDDLFELNERIKNTPGFVENEWTKCVQQCVDEFYEHSHHDDNGRAFYKPKTTYVEKALHFIAVDVESKLLKMQREIDDTIYKDDARVKQELKTLLDNIDKGFAYFWAASAQQYVEYVRYNLQKLYNQVLLQKQMKKEQGKT
jgi:FixJ family two-component response regulator